MWNAYTMRRFLYSLASQRRFSVWQSSTFQTFWYQMRSIWHTNRHPIHKFNGNIFCIFNWWLRTVFPLYFTMITTSKMRILYLKIFFLFFNFKCTKYYLPYFTLVSLPAGILSYAYATAKWSTVKQMPAKEYTLTWCIKMAVKTENQTKNWSALKLKM